MLLNLSPPLPQPIPVTISSTGIYYNKCRALELNFPSHQSWNQARTKKKMTQSSHFSYLTVFTSKFLCIVF